MKEYARLKKMVPMINDKVSSKDAFTIIADKIEKLEEEKKALEKKLDTVNENYRKVGEYYNLAFSFFAETRGKKIITVVGEFYNWLKPELREGE